MPQNMLNWSLTRLGGSWMRQHNRIGRHAEPPARLQDAAAACHLNEPGDPRTVCKAPAPVDVDLPSEDSWLVITAPLLFSVFDVRTGNHDLKDGPNKGPVLC